MATYAKGLARRANLTEGSARAAKSYKAKVASLTSERASLQAQIRELTEELVKHRSDLKQASVVRARAEDKEKEARKNAKVAEDGLWLAREELQAIKGDMWAKMGVVLLLRLLGLRFLTPLLSQVGAQRQAFRFCFFFFKVSWRGAWVFVLLLILTIC